MGIMRIFREHWERCIEKSYAFGQIAGEWRKIRDPRKKTLIASVRLDNAEKAKIDNFYREAYGKKIPYHWHRYFQSFFGTFHEDFFPEYLFSGGYEPKVNPRMYRYVLGDKHLLPLFVCGETNVKVPENIASYCNGVYFNNVHHVLTLEQLASELSDRGRVVMKKTQDTSSGRDVQFLEIHNGHIENGKTILEVIKECTWDSYVIQERIRMHPELSKLNPTSVNTFRVVTYLWNGKVYHWPVALRIGRKGSLVDNAHAGGIFVGVSDNGKLAPAAFTEFRESFEEHPDTHIRFEDVTLPFVPEIIAAAERMHLNAPQLGVISWDLTMNESGQIILLEVNTEGQAVWLPQIACGEPAFRENTREILQFLSK